MSFDLVEERLSDLLEVTDFVANGSFAALKANVSYLNGAGYAILVRLVDHNAGWRGEKVFVDEHAFKFLRKSALTQGDIVIANVGANAGTVFRVPLLDRPSTLGPNAVRVRPKIANSSRVDNDFLFYYLASPGGQEKLQSIITGSAQPKFNKTALRSLTLALPDTPTQREIAALMCALDDRITLLRETNATLEAIAQALFKSWFVDFDPVHAKMAGRAPEGMDAATAALFPDGSEESALGLVPKGWQVATLGGVSDYLSRGRSPQYVESGGVLVLNQKCVRDFAVDYTKGRRHDLELRKIEGRQLVVGDVLVNSTGVGTLGRVAQVLELPEPAIVDAHVTVLRAGERLSWAYLGEWAKQKQPDIEAMGEGSTGQTELSRSKLGQLPILVPSAAVLQAFDAATKPLKTRVAVNEGGAQTLATLRDTLLPRLISGQLRLPENTGALAEEVCASSL